MQQVHTIDVTFLAAQRRRRRRGVLIGVALLLLIVAVLFPIETFAAIAVPFIGPALALEMNGSVLLRVAKAFVTLTTFLVGVYVVLVLASPRKPVVLFLRRFRLQQVSAAISEAIEGGLGRHGRVVTLDDGHFVPLEVPRLERRLARYAPPFPTLVGVAVVALAVWSTSVVFGRYGFSITGIGVGAVLVLAGFLAIAVAPIIPAVQFWFVFLLSAAFLHRRRVKTRARLTIASATDLTATVTYAHLLSRRFRAAAFLAPQATVVRVVDALWQDTVRELARTADAIVIDVSTPSAPVLWEVESTLREHLNKVVFVGKEALVAQWASPQASDASNAALQIRELLDGACVLVYDAASRRSRRTFRRSLENAVNNSAAEHDAGWDLAANWKGVSIHDRVVVPPLWRAALLYVALGAAWLIVNHLIWVVEWPIVLRLSNAAE